jgi:FkbM family methyltransferase
MQDFGEMSFLLHVLREQSLFLDVGANVGVYTVLASAVARAKSVSFEPLPSAFHDLLRNVRLNGVEDLCELHNVGLAGADGMLKFTRDSDTMNHVVLDGQGQRTDIVEVPVTTLDAVVGTRTPSLLKIDVEGFETEILRGAEGVLSRDSLNAIIIELNGAGAKYGFDEREIHHKMLSLDFAPYYYLPFERKLCELASKNLLQANTIYVRNLSLVRTLVSSAARQSVLGCYI